MKKRCKGTSKRKFIITLLIVALSFMLFGFSANDNALINGEWRFEQNVTFDKRITVSSGAVLDINGTTDFEGAVTMGSTLTFDGTSAYIDVPEMTAPGNPASNVGRLYVADSTGTTKLYFKDSAGTVTDLTGAVTTTLDIAYTNGNTIDLDSNGDFEMDLTVTGRKVQIANTFAGTQAVALEIDAEVAQIITDALLFNTTAGTITDAIDASDAGITNALNIGANTIIGTNAAIDLAEFDVASATGAITIDDDGDVGSITIEGSTFDIDSLDFVGAGEVTTAASSALTLNPDGGNAAGEDLVVTAHNVQLTAAGKFTMSPDAAETLAIDLTDTDYTNALSVGDNAIVGTTGEIDYTNFDVNADGDVECVDLTASGNVNVGTFQQDALVPASAAPHTITLDGAGAGGVTIGATSTGNITLGDDVVVSDTYNVTIGEGKFTVDDDQNETAAEIQASHTTTGSALLVTSAATSAKSVSITADDLIDGTVLYLDATEATLTSGKYIQCYDGAADDFSVAKYGATIIAGNASTDVLTITAGDVQITSGDIDLDSGFVAINTAADETTSIARNQAATTGPVFSVTETNAAADNAAVLITQNATAATSYGLEIDSAGGTGIHFSDLVAAGDGIKFDVANSYTGQGIVADLGPWLGTAGEGFIDITSDSGAVAEAGHVIHINLQGTTADAAAISGKGLYIKDAAAATAGSYLLHVESDVNGAAYLDGDIDVNLTNNDDFLSLISNANDYAAGSGVVTVYDDSTGQTNAQYLLRLAREANGDAQDNFILCEDNSDGSAGNGDDMFKVDTGGAVTAAGALDIAGNTTLDGDVTLGDAVTDSVTLTGAIQGATPIVLDGATDNTNEVTLGVTDPSRDTTLTIPDSPITGGVFPVILGVGSTQASQAGAGTADVTGSSIAIPASHATAGQVYSWEVCGTKTGANAAMIVHLYALDGTVMSLTGSDAAAGDWVARFKLYVTGGATQDIHGELLVNGKVAVTDFATGAKDLATAGGTVKLQIQSQNAGDTVTSETVSVTFNE